MKLIKIDNVPLNDCAVIRHRSNNIISPFSRWDGYANCGASTAYYNEMIQLISDLIPL
jgi:hypothetical protein